jgi:exonuclease III
MIVLSWNVRGLNSIPRQKAVRRLIESQSPDVIFLQETKLSIEGLANCASRIWPLGSWQGVGALNCSGGVACFWDPRKVSPLWWISSRFSISLVASSFATGEMCLFSNIYAPTDYSGKAHLWNHIRFIRSLEPFLPWIMAGDFNAVTSLEEKRGGIARLDPSSNLLRDMIGLLNLIDVKTSNGIFTWNNRRCGSEAISERLDRFLVSCYWLNNRWITNSEILDWRGSDHWPIKLSIASCNIIKRPSFKFQLMWLRDLSLFDLMVDWWYEGKPAHGTAMYTFSKRLQHVKYRLKRWNKHHFGNLHTMKVAAQTQLDTITRQIRDQGMTSDLSRAEFLAIKDLEEWELREEIFWKQKSRVDWLQEGDRNTAFFHNSVKARRQGNTISSLVLADGNRISSCGDISREAVHYFSNLFSKEAPPREDEERLILECIPLLVSTEMNEALLRPILLPELEKVVFNIKKARLQAQMAFRLSFFRNSGKS